MLSLSHNLFVDISYFGGCFLNLGKRRGGEGEGGGVSYARPSLSSLIPPSLSIACLERKEEEREGKGREGMMSQDDYFSADL
jgi:hypothetical protein